MIKLSYINRFLEEAFEFIIEIDRKHYNKGLMNQ